MTAIDFEVQKFTRRCAGSDRDLAPGETFYSVLVPNGPEVKRLDYSESAWEGAPDDAIGHWKSEVPGSSANRMQLAPNDVLLHYFESMHDTPDHQVLVYVLSLLMIRRRIFKMETSEQDEQGREVLLVFCPRNEKEYRVVVTTPDTEEIERVQQQLAELLFAKAD